MLFLSGAAPSDFAWDKRASSFQRFVINTQIQMEDRYFYSISESSNFFDHISNSITDFAKSCSQKAAVLCDRGIMDGSAYVSKEIWSGVLAGAGLDSVSAREGRYDAVFHLVTAADGAESYYSLANNEARHESIEDAVKQDRKTQVCT
jgi:hypothetical protein